MNPNKPKGLYFHLPFCLSRCPYCNFNVVQGRNPPIPDYLKALEHEVEQKSYLAQGHKFTTIYFGGGTPSLFAPEAILHILEHCKRAFSWENEPEVTLEINPRTVTKNNLRKYCDIGVNRISIGAQAFDDSLLKALGRVHKQLDNQQCLEWSREAGFKNVNIDLLYGLPDQSVEQWEESLEQILTFKPEHLSLYCLTVEPGTGLEKMVDRKMVVMPPEEMQVAMNLKAHDFLTSKGFVHYEISNYALPGRESRHNMIYWNQGKYLGLGLGAHSFWDGVRSWNGDKLPDYLQKLFNGSSPLMGSETLSPQQQMSEYVFLHLRMLKKGVETTEFKEIFGLEFKKRHEKEIKYLVSEGFLENQGESFMLTKKGMPLADRIAEEFF